MQLGALFSGMAIENSMLGAAHATANPITARHGVTHGQAVGMMLPAVIRFNGAALLSQGNGSWYTDLAREVDPMIQEADAPERLAQMVEGWLAETGLASRLAELDIKASQLDSMIEDALAQWTGTFNPIPIDGDSVRRMYQEVLG
jgi:alcohol dehydrogenase